MVYVLYVVSFFVASFFVGSFFVASFFVESFFVASFSFHLSLLNYIDIIVVIMSDFCATLAWQAE